MTPVDLVPPLSKNIKPIYEKMNAVRREFTKYDKCAATIKEIEKTIALWKEWAGKLPNPIDTKQFWEKIKEYDGLTKKIDEIKKIEDVYGNTLPSCQPRHLDANTLEALIEHGCDLEPFRRSFNATHGSFLMELTAQQKKFNEMRVDGEKKLQQLHDILEPIAQSCVNKGLLNWSETSTQYALRIHRETETDHTYVLVTSSKATAS
jgi:hypothetical protein